MGTNTAWGEYPKPRHPSQYALLEVHIHYTEMNFLHALKQYQSGNQHQYFSGQQWVYGYPILITKHYIL